MNMKSGTVWGALVTGVLALVQQFLDKPAEVIDAATTALESNAGSPWWMKAAMTIAAVFTVLRLRAAQGRSGADDD